LNGVYTVASSFAPAVFHPAQELEQQDITRLLHTIRTRILRLLHRRGPWPATGEEDSLCESEEPDSVLPFLTAASIQGRVALGPESGERIERLAALVPRPGVHLVTYLSKSTGELDCCNRRVRVRPSC